MREEIVRKTTIRVASKNMPLACLTFLLILSGVSLGQTTQPADEPTTRPVLTVEQQIAALDATLNNRTSPPTSDERAKLAMQRFQLRQQLSQEQAIMNAPRLAADKAARDARAAAEKAKIEEIRKAMSPAESADLDKQDAIATAIKEKRIINGMTVEQAEKAILVRFQKRSGGSSGDIWAAYDAAGTEHTLEVQDGRVTGWHDYR